jgi:hypothetical protein
LRKKLDAFVSDSDQRCRRGRPRRRGADILRRHRGSDEDGDDANDGDDRKRDDSELPFYALVLRVGMTLGLICVTFASMYRYMVPAGSWDPRLNFTGPADWDDDDDETMVRLTGGEARDRQKQQQQQQHHSILSKKVPNLLQQQADPLGLDRRGQATDSETKEKADPIIQTPPPLPRFTLSESSTYDAYALSARFRGSRPARSASKSSSELFWQSVRGLLREFSEQYGGKESARAILDRGLWSSGSASNRSAGMAGLERTACRVLRARRARASSATNRLPPFRMVFGGYSVTAGRGNYFAQSFPFVMEKQLHTLFHLLNLTLVVENHAIGGVPSFPYGWCMENFFGGDYADTISWDFSMNEAGGDPLGLEAYLRHALQLANAPKVFVKDTHLAEARRRLLERSFGDLDHVVIHTDPASQPFLRLPEQHRPIGFREWRKFGSPVGAPGQSLHHPAVKEHAFIAWLHTMHMLPSLQLVQAHLDGSYRLSCENYGQERVQTRLVLSPPSPNATAAGGNSSKPWRSIFFGEPSSTVGNPGSASWHMNPVHCRTSFEPIRLGDLSEIIVWGSTGEEIDIMLPKSNMFYNRGWVIDMSDKEKAAKRKLDFFGGMGFLDRKKAYYGLFTSGMLSLLLDYQPESVADGGAAAAAAHRRPLPREGDPARRWYRSVVLCQVNEKQDDPDACDMGRDVAVTVGGVVADATIIDASAALYLGKKLCLYVPVPPAANLTSRKRLLHEAMTAAQKQQQQNLRNHVLVPSDKQQGKVEPSTVVGLAVGVTVNNRHIMKASSACSISHVVWEQQPAATAR